DVLTCIREKCTIQTVGFRLYANAERHLKPIEEMHRLFRQYPQAITHALSLAEDCTFSLDELQYIYPEEIVRKNCTPIEELAHLTWEGARERFGETLP